MSWTYQGKTITAMEDIIEVCNGIKPWGFIYTMTDTTGKSYIGKKCLTSRTSKPLRPGSKRKKWTTKESNWQDYHSSSKDIKAAMNEGMKFSRTILIFVPNSKLAYYYENKLHYTYGVIEPENSDKWYNKAVDSGKYRLDDFQ